MNPRSNRPIFVIGAGGIVATAHLPAYCKAGFCVAGIYDVAEDRAQKLATEFGIEKVFSSLGAMVAGSSPKTIFDVAVPAAAFPEILRALPPGAAVLLQKPMGQSIEEARLIRSIVRERRMTAAENFQLRFAPAIVKARQWIGEGRIGELHDLDVRVTVETPWKLWPFLEGLPRMEIPYHSIHYIDLIRSFLGDPTGVYARTVKHPLTMNLASTRTSIILNYGDRIRANIETNHEHIYGPRYQESYIKWEGTKGAIRVQLGVLMDYPRGQPDQFEYVGIEPGQTPVWRSCPLSGTWFPDAFMGSMGSLMDYLDGACDRLPTSVEDAYKTMAVVEAAYESDASGGVPPAYGQERL